MSTFHCIAQTPARRAHRRLVAHPMDAFWLRLQPDGVPRVRMLRPEGASRITLGLSIMVPLVLRGARSHTSVYGQLLLPVHSWVGDLSQLHRPLPAVTQYRFRSAIWTSLAQDSNGCGTDRQFGEYHTFNKLNH